MTRRSWLLIALCCALIPAQALAAGDGPAQGQGAHQGQATPQGGSSWSDRVVLFAAESIAAQIGPVEPPGFQMQVIEDGAGLDLTQRFKNKARSFCAAGRDGKGPGTGRILLMDQGVPEWRIAGPLTVRCDAPPPSGDSADFALFGVDVGLINQSAAAWQARLRRLPAQLPQQARLGYLLTEAYYQAQRDADPVMARSRCPELTFAALPGADGADPWLAGFSYHLCTADNGQILGGALDLSLFGHFGFQEGLRSNLERLRFADADKRRLVRFLLRRAARGPDAAEQRLDLRYFQADRPGSSCAVEAVAAQDPTGAGPSLGVDLQLSCTLALGSAERRVTSSLRFGEARKLSYRRYNFRAPSRARARYIKAIGGGLLQSVSEDGKGLGLIVFFNENDEPSFTLDNDQEARVLGVDILNVDQVTVAGAALEYRPRRAEAPCVLGPRKLVLAAISYDSACELRVLSSNGFSYRIYSVSREAEDLSCTEEQRMVAPESGTTCRIADVQCPDLLGARFVINVEAAKNVLVPVCSETPTN